MKSNSEITKHNKELRRGVPVKIWRELDTARREKLDRESHLRTFLAEVEEPGGEGDCI